MLNSIGLSRERNHWSVLESGPISRCKSKNSVISPSQWLRLLLCFSCAWSFLLSHSTACLYCFVCISRAPNSRRFVILLCSSPALPTPLFRVMLKDQRDYIYLVLPHTLVPTWFLSQASDASHSLIFPFYIWGTRVCAYPYNTVKWLLEKGVNFLLQLSSFAICTMSGIPTVEFLSIQVIYRYVAYLSSPEPSKHLSLWIHAKKHKLTEAIMSPNC